jgi:hypothetical protein
MNLLRTPHAFRLSILSLAPAARALLLLALVAPAGVALAGDGRAPDPGDCQQLQVQQRNKVAFEVFGIGVQIYQWNGSSWVLVAPQAVLYANAGHDGQVGIHFAGPTWQSNSGSKVVGTVIDHCTPDPTAIPWLVLKSASTEVPDIFDHVTFLQRLNTVGGIAPAVPVDFPGQTARVPYSATYVFYKKAAQ